MNLRSFRSRFNVLVNLGLTWDGIIIVCSPWSRVPQQYLSVGSKRIQVGKDFYDTWNEIFVESEYNCLRIVGKQEPPTSFVDFGANAGWATIWFFRTFGPVQTYAFEPVPRICQRLRDNTAGLPHVHVVNAGVHICDEKLLLFDRGAGSHVAGQLVWDGRPINYGDVRPVECTMIDVFRYFENVDLGVNAVLKMDIEGAEHIVCADPRFKEFVRKFRHFVVEIHDQDDITVANFLERIKITLDHSVWISKCVKETNNVSVLFFSKTT
jgi:FkbM family methyltransferase